MAHTKVEAFDVHYPIPPLERGPETELAAILDDDGQISDIESTLWGAFESHPNISAIEYKALSGWLEDFRTAIIRAVLKDQADRTPEA